MMKLQAGDAAKLDEIVAELRAVKVPTFYVGQVYEAMALLQEVLNDTREGAPTWQSRVVS